MNLLMQSYTDTIASLGALALLLFCQILIADVVGLRAKHIPGSQVSADHDDLLFRASRAVANTNESIAVFILAVLFCMLSGAPAANTAYAAWGFVLARFAYAMCYYANLQMFRSVVFAISLLALAALMVIGCLAGA